MTLAADRFFDPDPALKNAALQLYSLVQDLPIVSPHGHVDPSLFSDPDRRFGNPVELLIQPDHYVLRMLASQGHSYEQLLSTDNPRQVWQLFAENFHLFRGTPSGMWFTHELEMVFGVHEKLNGKSAARIYDQIEAALASPSHTPRALYERLNIAVIATTDSATDPLPHHRALRESGWSGRFVPTFRPDNVINLDAPGWNQNIQALSAVSGVDVSDYTGFIRALERQRAHFKSLGATASDFGPSSPRVEWLSSAEAEAVFQRALRCQSLPEDAPRFLAHMLGEMARMSAEDGLVMQLHPGVFRNHSSQIFSRFGADRGFDIPAPTDYVHNL
ncbi:MAG: glucuronate isomerase, partial [Bacteroidota bacterium]